MSKATIIGTFGHTRWGLVTAMRDEYAYNGALAITLVTDEGEPLATLSTNVDGSDELPDDHFYAKTWSENEEIAGDALRSGLFEETTLPTYQSGFVTAPVWKIKR